MPSKLCGVQQTALGSKEAEIRIIGGDLHAQQQTVAMLETDSGELVEKTLQHVIGGRTLLAKPGSYLDTYLNLNVR